MGDASCDATRAGKRASRRSLVIKAIIPLAVGVLIALIPPPSGLAPKAWYFFSLFAAVVVGLIIEPIPAAAVGFLGIVAGGAFMMVEATPARSITWALSGFSNQTVWLIFAAFMFALGYEKTGLGRRIGLVLVRALGRSTLGLGYAIVFSDLILAPFMPSNTARSAGTIYPIIENIPGLYGSEPGESARRIGAYIMWRTYDGNAARISHRRGRRSGMNLPVLSLLLVHSLGIMGIISPYGTGPSPVYFGSGYIRRKDFWVLGLIFGVIFLAALLLINTPYLLMIKWHFAQPRSCFKIVKL